MPNPVPKDLRIMRALTTLLEGSEGFRSETDAQGLDMTGKVFRGMAVFSDKEIEDLGVTEFLSILEAPRPVTGEFGGTEQILRNDKTWQLLVQGFIKDNKKHPSDPGYWLKAAVVARLARIVARDDTGDPVFESDYMLGKLVVNCTIGQAVVRPPPQGITRYAMFYCPLTFQLVTDVLHPYD